MSHGPFKPTNNGQEKSNLMACLLPSSPYSLHHQKSLLTLSHRSTNSFCQLIFQLNPVPSRFTASYTNMSTWDCYLSSSLCRVASRHLEAAAFGKPGQGDQNFQQAKLVSLVLVFCLKWDYKRAGEGLLTRAWSDRTRGNGFKQKEGRCRLDIRKKFFTLKVVRPWLTLPREAMAAPSLAVFKARLDGALSNLGWWKLSLPMVGCWNQMFYK